MIDPLSDPRHSDSHTASRPDEKTTVLPETAVALVEMERLQGELAAAEETRQEPAGSSTCVRWRRSTTSASVARATWKARGDSRWKSSPRT